MCTKKYAKFTKDPLKHIRGPSWLHKLHILHLKKRLKWLRSKGGKFWMNSNPINNPHARFPYVHIKYARFQKGPSKIVRVAYTNSIPYNAKNNIKWPSSKGHNYVKINLSLIKNPNAHLHNMYAHNSYARFQTEPLKTVVGVAYTNSIVVKCDERMDWWTIGQGQY